MPKQIGKYRIKKLIGTGGMGSVYQAVQEQPRRNVAIKLMKSGVASSSALRRFEYESQLLARLRHPGIAEVYDAGTHEAHDGSVPYFVMEYIAGAKRITEYVRDKKLGTRERLKLFVEVASAVHHGHTKGIIHRDLKPDNIIVDSHGRVKVIDFGVARATDSDLAVTTLQTNIGQLIGTVQYMSPEQVEADPDDIDVRSDIYALGVVLYEVLCGKPPYDVSKLKIYDATRAVRETEAHKLSTIDTTLRGDVETIVAKALEKDRDRRYQTAQAFGADIEHFLNDEPITARPASLVYQTRVFARRNKAVVIGVSAVVGALLLGLIVSLGLYAKSELARRQADEARLAESEQRKVADREKAAALEAQAAALEAQAAALEANDLITQNLYYADMAAAGHANAKPDGLTTVATLTDKWIPTPPVPATATTPTTPAIPELRGWEWYYLRSQLHQDVRTIPAPPQQRPYYAWTASGIHVAMRTEENTVNIHDAYTSQIKHTLPTASQKPNTVAWSPDAQRITTVDLDGSLKVWNAATGRLAFAIPGAPDEWGAMMWSFDGQSLAACNAVNNSMTLFDATTGNTITDLPLMLSGEIWKPAWSPDNTKIAAVHRGVERIHIWDTNTGEVVSPDNPKLTEGNVFCVAWSPDGKHIATGHTAKFAIHIWDVQTGRITQTLSGHENLALSLAWSADGQRLVSGGVDKTVILWDVETAEALAEFRGHEQTVTRVSWSPDETQLISSDRDALKIWDATPTPHMSH
ncbi:MAG: protein kinase domain-containing protein, partial [Planctomycetota bacterium]